MLREADSRKRAAWIHSVVQILVAKNELALYAKSKLKVKYQINLRVHHTLTFFHVAGSHNR